MAPGLSPHKHQQVSSYFHSSMEPLVCSDDVIDLTTAPHNTECVKLLHTLDYSLQCLHSGDGLWKETVPDSVCPGSDGPVAPARGQQAKQVGGRMSAESSKG